LTIALAEATSNEVIYEVVKLLVEKVRLYAGKFLAAIPRAREKAISAARRVFSLVVRGESKKAAESMRMHLKLAKVKDRLKDVISEGIAQTSQKP
jgi:DNA-binding FadR family transcriptional regulator